jgi:hypothetical protein
VEFSSLKYSNKLSVGILGCVFFFPRFKICQYSFGLFDFQIA